MPVGSIIDTHLHLWDPGLIHYPWLVGNALLNRRYTLEDYWAATGFTSVESMVFVQCEAEFSAFREEAAWVAALAMTEPRIKGLVAWAPLEKGDAVRTDLQGLKRYSILRGIRRIIQFEPDLHFCLRPGFIEGVRALKDFELSFDICIDHRHLADVLKLAEQVSDVPMVLDHIGKPDIKNGRMEPWASQMRELAQLPNVCCKISGVATEADYRHWSTDQLKPYIELALDAFGFDRVMFGGDWPVSTQAIQYPQWIAIVDEMLQGVCVWDQRKFWRDNAARIYRI
jgi:L-fuconolactonase